MYSTIRDHMLMACTRMTMLYRRLRSARARAPRGSIWIPRVRRVTPCGDIEGKGGTVAGGGPSQRPASSRDMAPRNAVLTTPVADLSGPRDELVAAVRQAFSFENESCPGMLRLKMAPEHAAMLRDVHRESRAFFDLPRQTKDFYRSPPGYPSGPHRCGGYKPQKAYTDEEGVEHVLNEWFVAGCPRPIDRSVEPEYYDSVAGHHFYPDDTPRWWPEAEVPDLRSAHDA